jgi:hypothetical protein
MRLILLKVFFIEIDSDRVADKSLQSTVLDFELPLSLFIRTAPPSKEAKYKITLCSNKEVLTVLIIKIDTCYIQRLDRIFCR